MLTENEIHSYIKEDVEKAINRLINRANELGGYDNITAILIYNN